MKQGYNNVYQDAFDKMAWRQCSEKSKEFARLLSIGGIYLNTYPQLAEDVFSALYKLDPRLYKDVPAGTTLARECVEKLINSAEYPKLRQYSKLNDFSAALTTMNVLKEFNNLLAREDKVSGEAYDDNREQKQEQAQKKFEQELKKAKSKASQGKAKGEQPQEEKQPAPQEEEKPKRDLDTDIKRMVQQAMKAALSKTEKDLDKAADTFATLGYSPFGEGNQTRQNFDKTLEMMNKVNSKEFKKVVDLIGRMKQIVKSFGQVKKESPIGSELCGVTIGGEIINALPSEMLLLKHPKLRLELFRRAMEKQLLQYNYKEKGDMGQGPIICLLDDSASMYDETDEDYRVKDTAAAVAYCLIEEARKQRRNFCYDVFSGGIGSHNVKGEFFNGKLTQKDILEFLSIQICGGTNYNEPLRWAMEQAKKSPFKKADIVLITDGDCFMDGQLLDDMKAFKLESEARVIVITLEEVSSHREEMLKEFSDAIYNNLGPETMKKLFKEVRK